MRIRRRADDASPPAGVEPVEPVETVVVGTGVEAVFAAVLDGRRLWLAVAPRPGALGLRAGAGMLDLPVETLDQPGWLSVRIDLASLPAAEAAYDVVLAGPGGVSPVTVAALDPVRVPLAPGGRARHELGRSDDGRLVLRTRPVAAACTLVAVTTGPGGPAVEVDGPDGPRTLSVADLLDPARPPVRRRDDDLPDPGRGAPLPGDSPARLRWSADGLL